jgi:hypothetical protein
VPVGGIAWLPLSSCSMPGRALVRVLNAAIFLHMVPAVDVPCGCGRPDVKGRQNMSRRFSPGVKAVVSTEVELIKNAR